MPGTRMRPNNNPILDMMRDGDTADMFGLSMSWGYGVAEVLYDADPNEVPPELGYRPSILGPEVPNGRDEPHRITLDDVPYETAHVWEYLHNFGTYEIEPDAESLPYWNDPTFKDRVAELRFAGRCLHRYIDWLREAGKGY